MRYMRELIADGFIGTPFIFNGYEQNSQWLDPMNPLRQVDPDADQSVLQVSSLEGYGAPIIDIAHLVGRQRPRPGGRHDAQLHPRAHGARDRPDDAHEHRRRRHLPRRVRQRRALLGADQLRDRRQLSRASRRASTAARARSSAAWSRRTASARRCARPRPIRSSSASSRSRRASIRPAAAAQESWRTLFYANLVSSFIGEILSGGDANEGDFGDGAWVQEVINAVEQSFRERRWVALPLAP